MGLVSQGEGAGGIRGVYCCDLGRRLFAAAGAAAAAASVVCCCFCCVVAPAVGGCREALAPG